MNKIISRLFTWLFAGIMLTFLSALYITKNDELLNGLRGGVYYLIFIAELVTVIVFSKRIHKMSYIGAVFAYLLYSFLTGLTLSGIFIIYDITSIIYAFGITSVLVLIFALIGYFTKVDLTKLSTYLFMGIIGILICSIVNMFIGSATLNFGLLILGVIIFIGYIAFDIQKVKENIYNLDDDKLPIMGAMQLYMDFINLFIRVLELFGKRRD